MTRTPRLRPSQGGAFAAPVYPVHGVDARGFPNAAPLAPLHLLVDGVIRPATLAEREEHARDPNALRARLQRDVDDTRRALKERHAGELARERARLVGKEIVARGVLAVFSKKLRVERVDLDEHGIVRAYGYGFDAVASDLVVVAPDSLRSVDAELERERARLVGKWVSVTGAVSGRVSRSFGVRRVDALIRGKHDLIARGTTTDGKRWTHFYPSRLFVVDPPAGQI